MNETMESETLDTEWNVDWDGNEIDVRILEQINDRRRLI
jgi:hypothetical protein